MPSITGTKRPAGRPARAGAPMIPTRVLLPQAVLDLLIEDFKGVTIETPGSLVRVALYHYLLNKPRKGALTSLEAAAMLALMRVSVSDADVLDAVEAVDGLTLYRNLFEHAGAGTAVPSI